MIPLYVAWWESGRVVGEREWVREKIKSAVCVGESTMQFTVSPIQERLWSAQNNSQGKKKTHLQQVKESKTQQTTVIASLGPGP